MNRTELLAIVEDAWGQLDQAIVGLDDAALIQPGVVEQWSVKDLLGHVAARDEVALGHIEQWRRGETPTGMGGAALDDFNAAQADRRAAWSLAQVQEDAASIRQRLSTALHALTDDDWIAVAGAGNRQAPLGDWVGNALSSSTQGNHAAEHAQHIREWRAARGDLS